MATVKTKRIVLASLLKPVDDPRMYYKFARSLNSVDKYEINIVGFPSKGETNDPTAVFHPLPHFRRKSGGRWNARITAAKTIWKLRPDILIVCTHELLSTALLCRFLLGTVVIYDVRENYLANLRHRNSFIASVLGWMVRLKESVASVFMDHHILAEECYKYELPFVRRKYTVIQNSALAPQVTRERPVRLKKKPLTFLFTGTLATQTGVFEAIRMIEKLRESNPEIRLIVSGNCMDEQEFTRLKNVVSSRNWIDADIDVWPIPYPRILKAISKANVGIIAYESHAFLVDKIPTKLFEYVANCLPILYSTPNKWSKLTSRIQAGICWNENENFYENIVETQYYIYPPEEKWFWNHDSNRLLKLINRF